MESTEQTELKADESQEDLLNKSVGTIEVEKLKPAIVKVIDVLIEPVTKKDSTVSVGKITSFLCKHPDKDDPIFIKKVLYRKDEKESVKESGLWFNTDKDENIQKGSALAILINHYLGETGTLAGMRNMEVNTEHNTAGFLCFKAY